MENPGIRRKEKKTSPLDNKKERWYIGHHERHSIDSERDSQEERRHPEGGGGGWYRSCQFNQNGKGGVESQIEDS